MLLNCLIVWLVDGLRLIVSMRDLGLRKGGRALHGFLSKRFCFIFAYVSEETTEKFEELGRQADRRFNSVPLANQF